MNKIKNYPKLILFLSVVFGLLLRVLNPEDMEWKEDEQYHFFKSQSLGVTEPWPWVGIPSGVYLVNPGMSVWIFKILATISNATTPTGLVLALGVLSWAGILVLALFARFGKGLLDQERLELTWASCFAFINPLCIWYQRKLWPEGFFMLFSTLVLIFWFNRHKKTSAFFWGLLGAILGQIHMSGFFSSFAVFIWTLFFTKNLDPHKKPQWKFWFLGSTLGALPLIPWAHYIFTHPAGGEITAGIGEAIQLKFWTFWASDPFGLHLGNTLGLHIGSLHYQQLTDFIRYPLIQGTPTYLSLIAHALTVGGLLFLIGWFFVKYFKPKKWFSFFFKPKRDLELMMASLILGFGFFMTTAGIRIRRYYMAVSFPFEFLFMVKWIFATSKKELLYVLWVAQLIISIAFLNYIHVNEGSDKGDYGVSYSRSQNAQKKDKVKSP